MNWIKTDHCGPIEYYLIEDKIEGIPRNNILEDAKKCPPIGHIDILNRISKDWTHLLHPQRQVYNFTNDIYNVHPTSHKETDRWGRIADELTYFKYSPTIIFSRYEEWGEDKTTPTLSVPFIVFIKEMEWVETMSEGCGYQEYDGEKYIGLHIQDIIKYSLTDKERLYFGAPFLEEEWYDFTHSSSCPTSSST